MTIEIADKLIKLRKKNGYSQEELADKLGLSRQAVSKWERAEASPDTDNLICLAKLYNVSLDELLSTDEDLDTIVKEQVKREEEPKGERVELVDDEGNRMEIKDGHIKCYDKCGNEVEKGPKDPVLKVLDIISCALSSLALITYIFLGIFLHMWHNGWIFFFVPDFVCSIGRAIRKKNAKHVNVVFLSIFVFFFVCLFIPGLDANLWHPMWTVFLLIPLYYGTVGMINKLLGKKDEDDDDDDKE